MEGASGSASQTFTTMCKPSCGSQLGVNLMGSSPLRAVLALDTCRVHRHVAAYADVGTGTFEVRLSARTKPNLPGNTYPHRRVQRQPTKCAPELPMP